MRGHGSWSVGSWKQVSRKRARPLFVLAIGVFVGVMAVAAAWAIDSRVNDGKVLPNLVMADTRLRGMDRAQLEAWVAETAAQFALADVEVRVRGGGEGGESGMEATVEDLGAWVDEVATVERAMARARTGPWFARLWDWGRSFLAPIRMPVDVVVDPERLERVVAERDRGRTDPVEPDIAVRDGRLVGVAGEDGRGINPAALSRALSHSRVTSGSLVIEMAASPVPPRFTQQDADRLAAEAERLATEGLEVAAGGSTATVPAESLREWVRAEAGESSLRLALREDADVLEGLASLLPEAGTRPVDAGFTVSGGQVSITPPRPGTACCAPEAVEALGAALADPAARRGPVALPLRTAEAGRGEDAARALGIVELVGTFTTPHAAGEPRVRNIQLMADTIRGTVVGPGETFSINGIVGRRTREKGYVEAPIISGDYKFEADVGGGVSQFATTMFNAAFFAGLDITEYYMHGLYISRYPYGREATLSFPGPDLKVRNNSPHGVLVWPTYTATSITVSLYSTRFVTSSEQTGQVRVESEAVPPADAPTDPPPEPPGPCVNVTTERTRVYLDGRSVVDRFSGQYAPAEGWSCLTRG